MYVILFKCICSKKNQYNLSSLISLSFIINSEVFVTNIAAQMIANSTLITIHHLSEYEMATHKKQFFDLTGLEPVTMSQRGVALTIEIDNYYRNNSFIVSIIVMYR